MTRKVEENKVKRECCGRNNLNYFSLFGMHSELVKGRENNNGQQKERKEVE